MNKINSVIKAFQKKEIIIILLSYQIPTNSINVLFQQNLPAEIIHNEFLCIKESIWNQKLNDEQIIKIIELLKKEIKNYCGRVILIIFSEYFFGRYPLNESERNDIIKKFTNFAVDNNDNEILFLMNFLYKLDKPLTDSEKEDLKIYLSVINSDVKLFNLFPTKIILIHDNINIWFTNESLMIYNEKIIFSRKKQAYSNEMNNLKSNFSLGFGGKQTRLTEKDPEYELYKYLNEFINIDICLDIQHKYSFNREKFMNNSISYLNKDDREKIEKIRLLFENNYNGKNYDKRDYYIIQSNTTNINENLKQFPNKKIIIQVDPKSSGIFQINYSKGFDFKINDLRKRIKTFRDALIFKNEEFTKNLSINKNSQEIELSRTLNKADEQYDILIDDLFESNFYNIIELVKPDNTIIETIDNIKLVILEHDLKNKKFD